MTSLVTDSLTVSEHCLHICHTKRQVPATHTRLWGGLIECRITIVGDVLTDTLLQVSLDTQTLRDNRGHQEISQLFHHHLLRSFPSVCQKKDITIGKWEQSMYQLKTPNAEMRHFFGKTEQIVAFPDLICTLAEQRNVGVG